VISIQRIFVAFSYLEIGISDQGVVEAIMRGLEYKMKKWTGQKTNYKKAFA